MFGFRKRKEKGGGGGGGEEEEKDWVHDVYIMGQYRKETRTGALRYRRERESTDNMLLTRL